MNQQRVGEFLRTLRTARDLTQEQLAEQLNVSSRTVSRWETGKNMPDISTLVELAELYDVSIGELVNGERKGETMTEEVRETAIRVGEYAAAEKRQLLRRIRLLGIIGLLFQAAGFSMQYLLSPDAAAPLQNTADFLCGLGFAFLALVVLYVTGLAEKLQDRKTRNT